MILNIEKKTRRIVDVNQKYDVMFFENKEVADDPEFQSAFKLRRATYLFDDNDNKAKEEPLARPVIVQHIALKQDQEFGEPHVHSMDQLVVVLHGSVLIGDVTINAPASHIISKGVEHHIVGKAAFSLIITLFV